IITDFDINAPFPKEFQLDITDFCNHRCIFCSNYKRKKKRNIDHEFAQKVLLEAYELGARRVGLYGTGEPLLNSHLADYTAHAKKLGYEYCYIDTNGALATTDRIIPVIQAGIDSIKFSINAGYRETYKEIHGRDDFETVITNLKLLWEYRNRPMVKKESRRILGRHVRQ
ncbi:MAG: radical SAM protein, partial [Euryarchaeota archaeon]|nr:radical SAM protein [Euryarchaeota archaeon]